MFWRKKETVEKDSNDRQVFQKLSEEWECEIHRG